MFQNPDNIIHQLFLSLGVDLDYIPQADGEFFTMALQFIAALWFIWWFVKMLYSLMRSALRGGV